MSEFTDDTIGRYIDQRPGLRETLLHDVVQHREAEQLRQTLAAVERAMVEERVPEEARRRVINRMVWGEPEGLVDVHTKVREQTIAAYDALPFPAEKWAALRDKNMGPTSSEGTIR